MTPQNETLFETVERVAQEQILRLADSTDSHTADYQGAMQRWASIGLDVARYRLDNAMASPFPAVAGGDGSDAPETDALNAPAADESLPHVDEADLHRLADDGGPVIDPPPPATEATN